MGKTSALKAHHTTKRVLKAAWREFIWKMLCSIALRASVMIAPIVFSVVIDSITNKNFDKAYYFTFAAIGIVIFTRISETVNTYTWHKLYNKLYATFTNVALYNTYNNSIHSLSRISLSEYINITNNDINIICEFFCNIATRIIRIIEFFIIFIYFFLIDFYIGIASVVISIIAFIILFVTSKPIATLNRNRAISLDKKTFVFQEIILGIREIKSLNILPHVKTRAEKATETFTNNYLKQRVFEDASRLGIMMLIEIFRFALVIYSIYLISQGKMELGVLLIIYNYYAQLTDNFNDFGAINYNIQNLLVSEARYNKILEYSRVVLHKSTNPNPNGMGEIDFIDVLYGYRDNPTLDRVNMKIHPNQITAITGIPGSGKSGILELLLKLNRQHEGQILIDGRDINDFDENSYFKLVTTASKDATFFNISIRDNLAVINSDFNKIVEVCKKLHIHEDIIQLTDGYDTIVDSPQDTLNSTTKSLLNIARVLLKNSKIMLFDETLSNLDKTTQLEILEMLDKLKKEHTIIIVTKDIRVLNRVDNIIFLHQSKVEAIGSHERLSKHSNLYNELMNIQ